MEIDEKKLNEAYEVTRKRIFSVLDNGFINQKEFARIVNVSPQTITDWKKGKSHSYMTKLKLISAALSKPVSYFLEGAWGYETTTTQTGATRIPVLGEIPAGIPIEAVEEILDWEEIPPEWVTGGRQYFGLKVKGDSMWPKYLDGDTVILLKENSCDSGDDCAVLVNGDAATLKQVYIRDDGSMEIRPLNPSYPPRTFTPSEIQSLPVAIAGVVVELRRKIK